jgi:surface antigen
VPSRWGNARSWLSSARRDGYAVGSVPKAGAIVVTTDSILGHVAYVESVSGNSILVSEMNYEGFGIISRRSIPIGSPIIRGYIY